MDRGGEVGFDKFCERVRHNFWVGSKYSCCENEVDGDVSLEIVF